MTYLFSLLGLIISSIVFAASDTPIVSVKDELKKNDPFQKIIESHYKAYAEPENFSAIQVSIKHSGKLHTYVKGTRSLKPDSPEVSAQDLFNLGSITKSFTAALAVLAETEGKLHLGWNLKSYLSNYKFWENITLITLLNMTSGMPNYSDSPKLNYLMSKNLKQFWSPVELIGLVYSENYNPPRKQGYFYTNSGYIFMDMLLSSQYKLSFRTLLEGKIISFLGLKNTFYPVPNYPTEVLSRMVRGYSYNVYDNPELLGQDVTENNLSWAGAAGAIVANSEDLVRWIEYLFVKDDLLNISQQRKMQTLVSTETGEPIPLVNSKYPVGFGLGLIKAFDPELGSYWYYQGETLGYRALYLYMPCNQVIITALFNSATNKENDHAGELMKTLYQQLLKQTPELICKIKKRRF